MPRTTPEQLALFSDIERDAANALKHPDDPEYIRGMLLSIIGSCEIGMMIKEKPAKAPVCELI